MLGYPYIVCSYKLYNHCKGKYPKRMTIADRNVSNDHFYYYNRLGVLRLVKNTKEVWTEADWPYIIRVR